MIESLILCGALICNVAPITEVIGLAAVQNGVSPELMLCIAFRESSLNPDAVGDLGLARGLFQFHLGTWTWMRGMMGASLRDQRADPWQASITAAWAVANGYGHHWSVWSLCN